MWLGLLIPILLIVAIAYAYGWRPGENSTFRMTANQKSPLDIVKDRYARGEISREEYEELRRDLA